MKQAALRRNVYERMYESETQSHSEIQLCMGTDSFERGWLQHHCVVRNLH